MAEKPVYALYCAGGGAHGAYQVGVLKYVHEHFCHGEASPFEIFNGGSCGSLNTSFYAAQSYDAHASRLWLEELWMGFHVPEYHNNLLKNILKAAYKEIRSHQFSGKNHKPWALLDPTPMNNVIKKGFKREHLEKAFKKGTTLGIGVATTELLSGRTCWFQEGKNPRTWNLFHSIGMMDRVRPAHVAASCSIPVFLPPVKIGSHYFLDGSLNLGKPFTSSLGMGATHILSIGTEKADPQDLPTYAPNFKPRVSNVVKLLLGQMGTQMAEAHASELRTINRFYNRLANRHRKRRKHERSYPLFHHKAQPHHYQPVEILLFYPSRRLRELSGVIHEAEVSPKKRKYRSRFMFHEKFIRELIDLGYDDAKFRHEELKQFFTQKKTPKPRWKMFKKSKRTL